MTQPRQKPDLVLWLIVVALAGWVVPGASYFLIKQTRRAIVACVTITLTFAVGLYIGSVGIVDSVGGWAWYMAQLLASPAVWLFDQMTRSGRYPSYGRPCDIGQIYTAVAGLLNLLCILSAVYMAYSGRGETIGQEESDAV